MTKYYSWDDGAKEAVAHLAMFAAEYHRDDTVFNPIFDALGEYVKGNFSRQQNADAQAVQLMQRAGIAALQVLYESEPFAYKHIVETLIKKQHDYGHRNILTFGMAGVAVRLCDKIARMENLLSRGSDAQNEALTDTYLDIVGYAAIALMLDDGSFELELEQDGK